MIHYHQARLESMTRRRLLAIAAGTAVPLALGIPTASAGVGSRIDSPLRVTEGGVDVTGVIGPWEADDVSAVFVAHIVQHGHVAVGRSGRYVPDATTFRLYARGHLHPGPATGHGTQYVLHRDGSTETYHWTVPVRLVDHAVGPVAA